MQMLMTSEKQKPNTCIRFETSRLAAASHSPSLLATHPFDPSVLSLALPCLAMPFQAQPTPICQPSPHTHSHPPIAAATAAGWLAAAALLLLLAACSLLMSSLENQDGNGSIYSHTAQSIRKCVHWTGLDWMDDCSRESE